MLTLKQLETFYWVAKLGTIQRAADKLFVTQSAATKRLQGIEALSSTPLFAREAKRLMLSARGREIYVSSEKLLESVGRLQQLQAPSELVGRAVRMGVTELAVLTWFPAFMRLLRRYYPKVNLQPEVDLSGQLREKVLGGHLDLAVVPESTPDELLAQFEVGRERFAWMCAPELFSPRRAVPLNELAKLPVIEQSATSIVTVLSSRMFSSVDLSPIRIQGGNNVSAIGSLIEAGVGTSCLPLSLFAEQLRSGRIRALKTNPAAPSVRYDAIYLKRPFSQVAHAMAETARESCQDYLSEHDTRKRKR